MKEAVKKSLVKDLGKAIEILENREPKDIEQLKELSDHTISDVALYKNLDAVSLAVLIYSIYKIVMCISEQDYRLLLKGLRLAQRNLEQGKLGKYNVSLKKCFDIIKKCSAGIKTHVRDVFYAAKIKKGSTLLEHGLSVARAASVLGISKWDLLGYAGSTRILEKHSETVTASKRLEKAIKIFTGRAGLGRDKKFIFFDSGPIITLAMSRLLWILEPLKEKFGGKFYITPAVKQELIERPLEIRRFQFEALQVMKLINDGILEVYGKFAQTKLKSLTTISNRTFKLEGKNWMEIIQAGELETIVAALQNSPVPIVMDERTLRLLIENSKSLKSLLERRSHKKVQMNQDNISRFQSIVGKIGIIRSVELAAVAFNLGILDPYEPKLKNGREVLLNSVIWATKFNGCAVTEHELGEIKSHLLK